MTVLRRLETFFALGLTLFAQSAGAAGLQAEVSSAQIALGDSVQLRLTGDAANLTSTPDLSPLQANFDILDTQQSRQMQIINGTRSDNLSWIVTLQPHQKGHLTIPSISAGTASSDPVGIDVVDAAALGGGQSQTGAAIAASMPQTVAYEQQEVPLTLEITLPEGTQDGQITPPQSADYILNRSGHDSTRQAIRNGHPVEVITRNYTLRPQKSGSMVIGPFTLKATMTDPAQGGFGTDPLAQMMQGSAFGGSLFGQMFGQGKPIALRSDPLALVVKPAPGMAAGEWFLPAKRVELSATWEPERPAFKVGEAVTRRVRIEALGASEVQLPDLTLPHVNGLKIYPDKTNSRSQDTPEGTAALREFGYSVLPTAAGKITLPEMRVKWFNTVSDKAELAIFPAETLDVAPGAAITVAPPVPAEVKTAAAVKTKMPEPKEAPAALPQGYALVDALAVVMALAGGLLIWRGRPAPAKVDKPNPIAALQAAAASGDRQRFGQAAQGWMREKIAVSGSIETVFRQSPALEPMWSAMEAAVYGGQTADWSPEAMVQAIRRAERDLNGKRGQKRPPALPALYPAG